MNCLKKLCSKEGCKNLFSFLFLNGKIKEQIGDNTIYYVRYSLFMIFLFSLFNFGYAFLIGFISAVMFPEDVIFFVGDKDKPKTLGILLGIAAGVTLFLGPLSGRTFVRYKGTSFLVVYAILGIFGMGCTCVAVTAYTALFPDLFHPSQYDIVSACLGFSQLLGGAIAVGAYGWMWSTVDYRICVFSASILGFFTMFPLLVFSEERGLKIKKEKETIQMEEDERKKNSGQSVVDIVGEYLGEEEDEDQEPDQQQQQTEEEGINNNNNTEIFVDHIVEGEEEEGGEEIENEENTSLVHPEKVEEVDVEDVSPYIVKNNNNDKEEVGADSVLSGIPGLGVGGDSSEEGDDLMNLNPAQPKIKGAIAKVRGKEVGWIVKCGCCCCSRLSKFTWRYIDPFLHWNFFWVFLARFVFMFSIASFQSYLLYFLRDCLDVYDLFGNKTLVTNESQAQSIVGCIVFFFGLVSSLGGPALSRRLRRQCVVSISGMIMVIGSTGIIVFRSYFTVIIFFSIPMGVGLGSFYAVDMALVNQVLPNPKETAKDLAIFAVATTIPFAVAAPVMGLLINLGNDYLSAVLGVDQFGYYLMFGFGIFVQIIGSVFVLFVRKKSKKQRLKEILNDLNMFDESEIEDVLEEKKKGRDNVMFDEDGEGSTNTIDHRGILVGRRVGEGEDKEDERSLSLNSPSSQIAGMEYDENSPIVKRSEEQEDLGEKNNQYFQRLKDDNGEESLLESKLEGEESHTYEVSTPMSPSEMEEKEDEEFNDSINENI